MNEEVQRKKIGQLIAKCWADDGFKQKLLADPAATLNAEGVEVPTGLSIMAIEDTDKVFHLIIPAKPTDLSDEDLDKVAGGAKVSFPCAGGGCFSDACHSCWCGHCESGLLRAKRPTDAGR